MSDLISILIIAGILPIVGGIGAFFLRKNMSGSWFATTLVFVALLLSIYGIMIYDTPASDPFEWVPGLNLVWRADAISVWLIGLVLIVSFLVHLFSIRYMEDDGRKHHYYPMLSLFTSFKIGLLLADHILLLFIFWELVGFSSYLLIGFWFRKHENVESARIAFITNRVSDAAMIAGLCIMISGLPAGLISELSASTLTANTATAASILFVLGAFGKSAQFPFYHWLPRAMAGPTPISALIHAATMVAAGIYLLVRISPIIPDPVLNGIAITGAGTALVAAISAMTQWDIKSVLAYSTISQLGYMVMAIGVGAKEMALFHLWTHGFFKAGLFLSAGAVIYFLHKTNPDVDAQDMRNMGGLRRKMPAVFYTYMICMLALSGLPFFNGFLSKEGILIAALEWASSGDTWKFVVPVIGFTTALLTAFYMSRQAILVFFTKSNFEKSDDTPISLLVPLVIFALGSLWVFYSLNPFGHNFWLVNEWFGLDTRQWSSGLIIPVISVSLSLLGFFLSYRIYLQKKTLRIPFAQAAAKLSLNAFYLDHFYKDVLRPAYIRFSKSTNSVDEELIDLAINNLGMGFVVASKLIDIFDKVIVDGIVNFAARISKIMGDVIRLFHSSRVQLQVFWSVIGIVLILLYLVVF